MPATVTARAAIEDLVADLTGSYRAACDLLDMRLSALGLAPFDVVELLTQLSELFNLTAVPDVGDDDPTIAELLRRFVVASFQPNPTTTRSHT